MKCEHCDTRIEAGETFEYRGHQFCINCASLLISWLLDDGMADDPDYFADVFPEGLGL